MGDIPVLTTGAAKVTPQAAQGEPRRPREKMIDRLFFNRRYHERGDEPVNKRVEFPLDVYSCQTIASFTLGDAASPLTDMALNLTMEKFVVEKRFVHVTRRLKFRIISPASPVKVEEGKPPG
jgi:hypothetical protein